MSRLDPGLVAALDLALRNLAAWSAQLALVSLAMAALGRMAPIERPAARLALGQALLALALVLPVLQPWRALAPGVDWSFGLVPATRTPPEPVAASLAAPTPAPAVPWPVAAAIILIVGAGLQAGRLALRLARLRALRCGALALDVPPWLGVLRAELAPKARFVLSERTSGPATFGLHRPTIAVPPAFLAMAREQQRAVAVHELLHVRRGDWVVLLLEEVLKALLFFHPAVHWLVGRVRLAREQCVDAEVVRLLGGRDACLDSLVEVARLAARARVVPAAPFLGESHLRERVELLLKEVPMSRVRTLSHLGLTAGALLLAGALAVSAFPLLVPGEPQAPAAKPQAAAGWKAAEPKLIHKVDPVYPADAKKEKVQGIFQIDVTIDKQGLIKEAKVVCSAPTEDRLKELWSKQETKSALEGDGRLANAALDAVRQWRYEPVLGPNGKPTEVKATVTVRFMLD
jgi:beta-lactamase regulating signal transducer with metallopeptidase domain